MRTRRVVATMLFLLILSPGAFAQTPALEVENSSGATLFQVNTDGSVQLVPQAAAAGLVLTATDASGNASWQAGSGFALPFSGTYNQVPPAFSITKNAGGSVMSLSSTAGGNVIFGSMTGGVPGSMAMRLLSSHGGFQMEAGNGFGLNVTNTSASATVRAVNNGAGVAGRFEGDVEVTGGLACTGCIDGTDVAVNSIEGIRVMDGTLSGADVGDGSLTGADVQNGSLGAVEVDATSGFYVSKTQLYVESVTMSVAANDIRNIKAVCRDANDLPLTGHCNTPSGQPVFTVATEVEDWTSTTKAASYTCSFRNESGISLNTEAAIVCIDVN